MTVPETKPVTNIFRARRGNLNIQILTNSQFEGIRGPHTRIMVFSYESKNKTKFIGQPNVY